MEHGTAHMHSALLAYQLFQLAMASISRSYAEFRIDSFRLVTSKTKAEFLALLQEEQDRESGPRDLPVHRGGVTLLHELVHYNAPIIDWGEGFLVSLVKLLEIWPDAASRAAPGDKQLPLHTYLDSARKEFHEIEADVVHVLVQAYPEALTMQCLPIMETPLAIMCRCEDNYDGIDQDLIEYILKKNPAAAAMKDSKGRYPLHGLMMTDPHDTWRAAEALYKAHTDAISTPDDDGNYPLHHAIDNYDCSCDYTVGFLCAAYPQAAAIPNNDNCTPMAIRIKRTGHEEDGSRITMMLDDSMDLCKTYSDYGLDDICPGEDGSMLDESISDLVWTDGDAAGTRLTSDEDDIIQINVIPTLTSGGSSSEFAICHDMTPKTYFGHQSVLSDESRGRCAMYFTAMLNSSFAEASSSSIRLHLHPDAASVFSILLDSIYYGKCDNTVETIAPFLNLCKYLRFRWGYDKAIASLHAILCRSLQEDRPVELLSTLLVQCFVNRNKQALSAILRHLRLIMLYYEDQKWESEPDPYSYFNSYSLDLFSSMMKSFPIKSLPWNSKCVMSFIRNSSEIKFDSFIELTGKEVLGNFIHQSASIGILKCALWLRSSGKDKDKTRKQLCVLAERCIKTINCDHQTLVKIAVTEDGISTVASLKLLDELEKICSNTTKT